MLAYTFMNLGAFAIITVLGGKGEEKVNVQDFTGLGYKNPLAAAMMSLFLFSLAGIPPTAGFMGKFYIFSAAIKEGFLGLAIIGVINSAISVYYYLRVTIAMYMKDPASSQEGEISAFIFSPAAGLFRPISRFSFTVRSPKTLLSLKAARIPFRAMIWVGALAISSSHK